MPHLKKDGRVCQGRPGHDVRFGNALCCQVCGERDIKPRVQAPPALKPAAFATLEQAGRMIARRQAAAADAIAKLSPEEIAAAGGNAAELAHGIPSADVAPPEAAPPIAATLPDAVGLLRQRLEQMEKAGTPRPGFAEMTVTPDLIRAQVAAAAAARKPGVDS